MTRRFPLFIIACGLLLAALDAGATAVDVTVDSQAMPWLVSANPDYAYGIGDGTAPLVVSDSSGLSFAAGGTITITYLSGFTNPFGDTPDSDAGGYIGFVTKSSGFDDPGATGEYFPTLYMPLETPESVYYLAALVGTFADVDGAIVGAPFWLGNGPTTVVVPDGAAQLQLGINDDLFLDNVGALYVRVSDAAPVPVPAPFLLLATGCAALATRRRRSRAA
jgi:hypothetical protein